MAEIINGLFPGKILPTKTLGGCIDVFENVWPYPENTIETVENLNKDPESGISWERATTLNKGTDQEIRTNVMLGVTNLSQITNNGHLQNVHNQFYMLLLATTIDYSDRYKIGEPLYHENYNMLRYRGGQQYHQHYDGSTKTGRTISAICYLNEDYAGGELEFPNFDVKIKPKKGSLLLFPSNYAYSHVAHPVTEGQKYALVTWIRDRYID